MHQTQAGAPAHSAMYIIRIYSLLGFLSLAVFGVLQFVTEESQLVGVLELAGSFIFLLNVLAMPLTRNVALAKFIFLLTVIAFLIVMLTTGGTNNTGIFWFFVFPVGAFFLVGKKQGMIWMAALCIATGLVWLLSRYNLAHVAYDAITLRQLIVSLLVVSVGIFAYQQSREELQSKSQASERALQSEQVQASVIVQHIDEGIVVVDTEGRVTFMNRAAEKLLGWDSSDLMGKEFVQQVPLIDTAGNTIPPASRPLTLALKTHKPLSTVATYKTKNGHAVPIAVACQPIVVEGENRGVMSAFRDITEEQTIARTKSEFVTLASHQLRTPISAISWLSELLINGDAGKLNAQQREHIQDIYASNRRMASLVNEMLIVSSLELGSMPVRPERTNVTAFTDTIIKEQKSLHKEATPRIATDYQDDLPELSCDPDVLRLLLRNLISNAIKYTPKEGHIGVKLSWTPNVALNANSEGSFVIAINDTGFGIPDDAFDKIFTKFYRAPNILHKDTDGTGLGLYIAKTLLDYVGGNISFTSHEGQGTTFTIMIPLEGMKKHDVSSTSVGATTRQGVMAAEAGLDV